MIIKHPLLNRRREHRQASEEMVPVALDAFDAKVGADGKVLKKSHGADVGQVFAAGDPLSVRLLPGQVPKQADIGDAFEHAFAVFEAGAGIAEPQSRRQAVQVGIRFVDDDGRAVGPRGRHVHGVAQRGIAVKRLLDKE
ncbi:MAG: hypothetical protein KatS3mg105_0462 [Gemmatales bacterium]|nr:MAG: hypothetical protein KatS3mg105_0462 [Gemmatales bacterium]